MKINKRKMIAIICVMSIALLAFSAVLNVMSYRKMQAETYVHAANLNTVSMVRKLNYALSFGKPLDKFYGLDSLLEEVDALSEDILGVRILDEAGNTIEDTGKIAGETEQKDGEEYVIEKDGIYSFISFDAGTIVLFLDSTPVEETTDAYIVSVVRADILLFGGILLILCCFCLLRAKSSIGVRQWKGLSLILLIGAQLLFGVLSTRYTITAYQTSVEQIAQMASAVVQSDINEVLAKGMEYGELQQVDEYLQKLSDDIPELSSIAIADGEDGKGTVRDYTINLNDEEYRELTVRCEMNQKLIQNRMINNVIDVLILVMVTIFISLEIIGFMTEHLVQRSSRVQGELYFPFFRLFVFVSGVAFSLDCGFISVLSNRLYEKMELPANMSFLSGLPNTMYSLAIVLGLLSCSFFISRLGMKRTLLLGVSLGVIGYLLCAAAVSLPYLVGARFVFGFCDGLVINAIRLYASAQKDKTMHTRILVTYLAAINLGICCSVVIGGLVADVASYNFVFLIGALLGVICLFLVRAAGFSNTKSQSSMSFLGAVKELRIGKVFLFMVFIVIPVYVATLYVGYTFPLYGDEAGLSNSLVSGCLMINYLIIAYLTDPVSKWVNRHMKPRRAMICYMILQAVSIGIFVVFPNIWTAVLALVLTSLWDCFGMVVIDSVLDDVEHTTTEKNTLLQMLFGKIGMVIGPMLVTAGLSGGAASATGSIVLLLFAGVVLYLVLGVIVQGLRKERRTA